jgi:hypothetical protein
MVLFYYIPGNAVSKSEMQGYEGTTENLSHSDVDCCVIKISDGEISDNEQPAKQEESPPVITILSSSSGNGNTSSDSESLPDIGITAVKHEQVDKLPYNIDGNVVYRLPYNPSKKMKSSLDGRPWKTWVTSLRKGLAGVRRRANCKGSYKCCNLDCSYKRQYKTVNRTQFEKEGGEIVCKCCGMQGIHVACSAVKVWEFPRNSKLVTIIHSGKHTCIAVPRQEPSKLESTFSDNPDLRPGQAAYKSVVNAMKAGKPWEEVTNITDTFLNTINVKNMKQKYASFRR